MTERVTTRLAYSFVVLYVLLVAAAMAIASRNGALPDGGVLFVGMGVYALVGGLVAARRPRNPIGWLLLCAPLGAAVSILADELSFYGFITAPGTVPFAGFAAWLSTWTWMVMLASLVFVVFLFPSGRLPSRGWRPIARFVAIVFIAVTTIFAFGTSGNTLHPEVSNPFALPALVPLARLLEETFGVFIFVFGLAVLSVIVRYRAASTVEKQQLKWIVMAGVLMIIALAGGEALPSPISDFAWIPGFLALPVAIAIAILRDRLYDIDVLINRTIVYGAVTATLIAIFFGGLVLLQAALRPLTNANELGVAASTLLSLALVQPIRRRIQSAVDRRFDRHKYNAERTLDVFSSRLRDEIDLDAVHADLVSAVGTTMAPAHISFWLRGRER